MLERVLDVGCVLEHVLLITISYSSSPPHLLRHCCCVCSKWPKLLLLLLHPQYQPLRNCLTPNHRIRGSRLGGGGEEGDERCKRGVGMWMWGEGL